MQIKSIMLETPVRYSDMMDRGFGSSVLICQPVRVSAHTMISLECCIYAGITRTISTQRTTRGQRTPTSCYPKLLNRGKHQSIAKIARKERKKKHSVATHHHHPT